MRIISEVLDPYLGCLALHTPNLRIRFELWDPDPIFRENAPTTCIFHGLGAGVVHETGSTGSTGNGPQLAVRTLGYSRLRPG